MTSVTCLRLSYVCVICRDTYLQFQIQACFSCTSVSLAAQWRTWFTQYRISDFAENNNNNNNNNLACIAPVYQRLQRRWRTDYGRENRLGLNVWRNKNVLRVDLNTASEVLETTSLLSEFHTVEAVQQKAPSAKRVGGGFSVSRMERTGQRNDFKLITTVTWKLDTPQRDHLVVNFPQSIISAKLWTPEVGKR